MQIIDNLSNIVMELDVEGHPYLSHYVEGQVIELQYLREKLLKGGRK